MAKLTKPEDPVALTAEIYRAVFRREADPQGLAAWASALANGATAASVLAQMRASSEFLMPTRLEPADYALREDPNLTPFMSAEFHTLSARMGDRSHFTQDKVDALLDEALRRLQSEMPWFGGQEGYVEHHRRRFWETANMGAELLSLVAAEHARILDVGVGTNSALLQSLFPAASVAGLDRPGFDLPPAFLRETYRVDLTAGSLGEMEPTQPFDLIVFAEVLEHLLANPVRVLRYLIGALAPGGFLLLTTPNFYSKANMAAVAARTNPQPLYPEAYGPADAPHFHVREYCMSELLHFTWAAGGQPAGLYFSECWDDLESVASMPVDQRSNLCVAIQRRS